MALRTVTLQGKYQTLSGDPATGTVSFELSGPLLDSAGNVIYPSLKRVERLDETGAFTVVLPATKGDVSTAPQGLTYKINETISPGLSHVYAIELDADLGTTQQLADIAPATNVTVQTYALVSTLAAHTAATENVHGITNTAQLATLSDLDGVTPEWGNVTGTLADQTDLAAALAGKADAAENLADLADVASARINLGLTQATYVDAVAEHGADNTGATDAGPAINAAIAAAAASSVKRDVLLRPGTYLINTTITIGDGSSSAWSTYHNVGLIGSVAPRLYVDNTNPTSPLADTSGVILKAGAAFAGDIVQVRGPIYGWRIDNLHVIGSNLVGQNGIDVLCGVGGRMSRCYVERCRVGIHIGGDSMFSGSNQNQYHQNTVKSGAISNTPCFGITIGTTTNGYNVHHDSWYDTVIYPTAGLGSAYNYGIVLSYCDAIYFHTGHVYRASATSQFICVEFNYGNGVSASFPMGCQFENIDWSTTTFAQLATNNGSGLPGVPNRIIMSQTDNGIPTASINLSGLLWLPLSEAEPVVTSPSIPASGVGWVNPWCFPVLVYITPGAGPVTVAVGSTTLATLAGDGSGASFRVPYHGTVTLTYSTAPASFVVQPFVM